MSKIQKIINTLYKIVVGIITGILLYHISRVESVPTIIIMGLCFCVGAIVALVLWDIRE